MGGEQLPPSVRDVPGPVCHGNSFPLQIFLRKTSVCESVTEYSARAEGKELADGLVCLDIIDGTLDIKESIDEPHRDRPG
jgi:hypothetical protein